MNGFNEQELINPSGIARLTGLKTSTISNWRRRDETFPQPVAGTDARPLFDLHAVKSWIQATGKKVEFSEPSIVLTLANMLRGEFKPSEFPNVLLPMIVITRWAREENPEYLRNHEYGAWEILAQTCAVRIEKRNQYASTAVKNWVDRYCREIDHIRLDELFRRVAGIKDLPALADELMDLSRHNARQFGGEHFSTQEFSKLLISLLPDGAADFADLGSGTGQTLLSASKMHANWRLHGLDISNSATCMAGSLLYVHDVAVRLEVLDLLRRPQIEQFDRVTFHAPFGIRFDGSQLDNSSWPFGKPPRTSGDVAWLQMAFQSLRDKGHAAVVVPSGVLFRGGINGEIIKRMASQGAIEAVLSLPANTQLNTSIPVSILLLRKGDDSSGGKVLMVDVSGVEIVGKLGHLGTNGSLDSVFSQAIDAVVSWRKSGNELSGISVAVPLVDLMAPDAALVPQRWIASMSELSDESIESIASKVEVARLGLLPDLSEEREIPNTLALEKAAEPVILRALPELGLEILRGDYSRLKADSDEPDEESAVPVVTMRTVRSGCIEELPMLVTRTRKNPLRTMAGDVLVASLGPRIQARVWHEAGLEVDRNVFVIRGLGHAWDADFVAQQLMSNHNQAMQTGASVNRVDVRQLLIPPLQLEAQRQIGQVFREINNFADAARQAAEKAELYVQTLRDAIGTGALTAGTP